MATVYEALPARTTMTQQVIPGRFRIVEYRNGDANELCVMSNQGDRLNNLLKRGIPEDQARKLFYQMDTEHGQTEDAVLDLKAQYQQWGFVPSGGDCRSGRCSIRRQRSSRLG